MKVIILLSTLSVLFLQSCASHKQITAPESYFTFHYDTIFHKYAIDLTKQMTGGIDLHVSDASLMLLYNYCGNNQLMCFYPTDDAFTSIYLESHCQKVYSKQIKNGLYVLTREGNLFYYDLLENLPKSPGNLGVDKLGIPGKRISNVKSDSLLWNLGLDIEQFKPGSGLHYNVPDRTFYFRVMKSFDTERGTYSRKNAGFPVFCKLDLVTGKKQFFGKQPLSVERSWYGLCSQLYDLYIGDSIIVSEGVNGKISIINTLNNTTTTRMVRSRYDTVPFRKFVLPDNLENAKTLKIQHKLESPWYEAIYYNPYTRYYYRIFHPAMEQYNSNGLLNTSYDKKCVLMIFDKSLNLLDEVILPLKATQAFQLHPIPNGIEICLPDLYKFTSDESKFALLKLTHTAK